MLRKNVGGEKRWLHSGPTLIHLSSPEVSPQRGCGLCPEARHQGQDRGCKGEGRRGGRGLIGLRASCVSFSGAEGQDMNPDLLGGRPSE